MSNEYLIHRYLSGELSHEEQKMLFDALSQSEELRNELSLQLRMQEEAQKDLRTVSVPPATTKAIFSSLGLSAPLIKRSNVSFAAPSMAAVLSVLALTVALATFAYMLLDHSGQVDLHPAETTQTTPQISFPLQPMEVTSAPKLSTTVAAERDRTVPPPTTPTPQSKPLEVVEATRVIPNEPIKAYFDIGKFASVDYLTQMKIIGVADAGKIYCSEDGGKSWVLQVSKTSNDLFGVNFVDTANGVVVGAYGTALRTPNAGRSWEMVETKTRVNLITVRYATRDTVFACGAEGAILRSTTGGRDWDVLTSGTNVSLFKIRSSNGSNVVVSGERGITLQTLDAGQTWVIK